VQLDDLRSSPRAADATASNASLGDGLLCEPRVASIKSPSLAKDFEATIASANAWVTSCFRAALLRKIILPRYELKRLNSDLTARVIRTH